MKHDFNPNILCLAAGDKEIEACVAAFAGHADVYALDASGPEQIMLRGGDGTEGPLIDPLTGPTVMAQFGETTAPEEAAAAISRVNAIWQDANLPEPTAVKVRSSKRAGLQDIASTLMSLQSALVTDAMRRNVSLLTQISALRQRSEDLGTIVRGLNSMLSFGQSNSHRLLYEGTQWGEPVTVVPGQSVVQRVPIVILPSLIGAVSANIRCDGNTRMLVRVIPAETGEAIEEMSFDLPSGRNLFFMPLRTMINPNCRLVDVSFENTGDAPMALETALQEGPEEALRIYTGENEPEQLSRAIQLGVWSSGPAAGGVFEAGSSRRQIAAWDLWRTGAKALTPGFENRSWVEKRGSDALLIHPLPDTTAVASCPLKAKGKPFRGVQVEVALPEKAFSIANVRLILTEDEPELGTAEDAVSFAAENGAKGEIGRTNWIQVPPGSNRLLSLTVDTDLRKCHANIAVTTNGRPVDFAHFVAFDMKLIIE